MVSSISAITGVCCVQVRQPQLSAAPARDCVNELSPESCGSGGATGGAVGAVSIFVLVFVFVSVAAAAAAAAAAVVALRGFPVLQQSHFEPCVAKRAAVLTRYQYLQLGGQNSIVRVRQLRAHLRGGDGSLQTCDELPHKLCFCLASICL